MFTPRPYQDKAIEDVRRSLPRYKSVMLVCPTGGGKTAMSCEMIRRFTERGSRGIAMMHRKELIEQWIGTLNKFGIQAGAIKAGIKPQPSLPVQVASVQSLVRRKAPKNITYIFIDEAHRTKANSYLKILSNYPDAFLIGVTATPIRSDGRGFRGIYNHMIVSTTYRELMEQGYLVPSKPFINPIDPKMLRKVKKRAGDYSEKELGMLMMDEAIMADLTKAWFTNADDKSTIHFAASVDHSKHVMEKFRDMGVAAAHIDGTTPEKEREILMRDFRSGQIRYLTNVGVATEGLDVPHVECVQVSRATKSYGLYKQMLGRGSRISPGKDHFIFLDHGNNYFEHGPPEDEPEWSLDGVKKKEAKEKAVKIRKKNEGGEEEEVFVMENELPLMTDQFELIEIDTTLRVDLIDKCFAYAKSKGHNPYSAFFNFKNGLIERGEKPSLPELHHIKRKLNFPNGKGGYWVKCRARELGIKVM